jgi:uncharacterized SAM-binding protein YcdF (DUF218 family)
VLRQHAGILALFDIAKIVDFCLQPSALLLILLLAASVLLWTRHQKAARGLVVASAMLLLVGGLLPLSTWLILPLEDRFQRADLSGRDIDGIIVLGGAEDAHVAMGRNVHALNEAGERVTEALALARRYPKATLVFTGGAVAVLYPPSNEADAAKRLLQDFGITERNRLVLEPKARNTWENAVYTKALLKPKPGERWLLVTSAWHMPRAMGAFREAGFAVEPWPVDYRTAGPSDRWRLLEAPSEGLRRLETALHEWIGLVAYRLLGRSNALFPSP